MAPISCLKHSSILLLILSVEWVSSADTDQNIPSTDFWYMIMSKASGKTLDIRSTDVSEIYPFRYLESQIFRFENISGSGRDTIYRIIDHEKDLALSAKANSDHIGLEQPNYEATAVNQHWVLKIEPFVGNLRIASVLKSEQCMDVSYNEKDDGTDITLKRCNDDPNQQWLLVKLCN